MTEPKKLFLREASGLVREVSSFKAMFFNFACMSGGIVVLNFTYSALYPAAPTFGLSSLALAQILIAGALVLVALIYVALLSGMPRTGGDYVFTSRILHPFLGWIETWTLMFSNLAIIGFELLQISVATSGFSTVMGTVYKNSVWSAGATFFATPLNQAVIGTVLVALMGVLTLAHTRKFHSIVSILAILGVSGVLIQIFAVPFLSGSQFAANFQTYSGNSTSQVIKTATTVPSVPLPLSPLTFAVLGPAIGFALFNLVGFQYSAYIGGELKGNIKRNGLLSTIGSLWLYTLIVWVILVPLVFSTFGYNFLHAWAYLYFNDASISPLGGAVPISPILSLLTRPDLWPLWLYVLVVGDALMFALGPAYLFMTSRMVFAWSMDRMIPGWFASVNERTHSPVRIYLLALIGGLAFFLMSFPPIGLNLSALAYYSILLSALTWILPGFNAVFLAFRRKDIYESTVFKKKVAGLPAIAWLGIIWLAIILPIYGSAFFQPLISSFLSSPTWQYANSSGALVSGVILIVGAAIYFVSKAYNKRRGIEIDLIFKTVPPE